MRAISLLLKYLPFFNLLLFTLLIVDSYVIPPEINIEKVVRMDNARVLFYHSENHKSSSKYFPANIVTADGNKYELYDHDDVLVKPDDTIHISISRFFRNTLVFAYPDNGTFTKIKTGSITGNLYILGLWLIAASTSFICLPGNKMIIPDSDMRQKLLVLGTLLSIVLFVTYFF